MKDSQPINDECSLLDELDRRYIDFTLAAYEAFNAASLVKLAGGSAEQIGKHLARMHEFDALADQVQREIRQEVDRQLGNLERPVITLGALSRPRQG